MLVVDCWSVFDVFFGEIFNDLSVISLIKFNFEDSDNDNDDFFGLGLELWLGLGELLKFFEDSSILSEVVMIDN